LVAAAVVASLVVSAPANAASSKYAPDKTARDFNGGVGGWTNSEEVGGLCLIQGLTCPSITNSHQGDFIRTSGDSLLGVVSSAKGVWESPEFEYEGAGGDEADSVEFSMRRRADVSNLVEAEGSAEYKVELVGGGATINLDRGELDGADDWTTVGNDVASSKLEDGTDYHFRITSHFVTTVTVVGQFADADYDDVELLAKSGSGGGGGGTAGGKRGPRGRPGKSGGKKNTCKGKAPSKRELRNMVTKGKSQRARVRGSRVRLRVRNGGKHELNCRVQVIGKIQGKTKSDRVRVRKGKSKELRMPINTGSEASLRAARRVKVRYKLKTEGVKTTAHDQVRVR
jgi:hypothetical protein